ncbi:hypothetical protein [Gelidibacter maritimus]|uniref:Uncharacterized protein n=1 Tax=Gelidibacter maritimus TaxID=2761487 RepID=A0A7W2M3S5_9FLAO|nr:hypothetical protein [Gelidibacter maritimus]MBA6152167.1 hypothetical protein [Gelidibacter maritimus]
MKNTSSLSKLLKLYAILGSPGNYGSIKNGFSSGHRPRIGVTRYHFLICKMLIKACGIKKAESIAFH